MDKEMIIKTIDNYVDGIKEIENNFDGLARVDAHEKEQKNYNTQFKQLGVMVRITSDIYSNKNNPKGIQKIKDNLEKYIIN